LPETANMQCEYCRVELTEGFMFDRGHLDIKQVAVWVEGSPETTFWPGLMTKGKGLFRLVAVVQPNAGHAFTQSTQFSKVFFQSFHLPFQKINRLVKQTQRDVRNDLCRTSFHEFAIQLK
jgi:hypothetical protein